jgi:DNA-directed RNA polymerase specialized sigma24 family protein
MGLDEAIAVLFGPPSAAGSKAYPIVASFLESRATRRGAQDAENVAQQVLSKLLTRARAGETPWSSPGAAKAYLAKCAERAAIDEHRREQRHSPLPTEPPLEQAPVLDGDERALIEKVAVVARTLRSPRYRAEFDATWSQLSALAFEDADLRELLQADQPGVSDGEFNRIRESAYKRHERMRKSLLAAAHEMQRTGQLSPDDAQLALASLRVLVRCQRSEPRNVSRSRKDGS